MVYSFSNSSFNFPHLSLSDLKRKAHDKHVFLAFAKDLFTISLLATLNLSVGVNAEHSSSFYNNASSTPTLPPCCSIMSTTLLNCSKHVVMVASCFGLKV